jgi:ribosomal 50S subunit-recycling heat shock protein
VDNLTTKQERSCGLTAGALRLDLFLKYSRLILRRTLAHEACSRGSILVNGKVAKPARLVQVGDILQWKQKFRTLNYRILRIPAAPPNKKEALPLVELLGLKEVADSNHE